MSATPTAGNPAVHPEVTFKAIMETIEDHDHPGVCIACGAAADSVEPDAANYPCDDCGRNCVYGTEELVVRGLYH